MTPSVRIATLAAALGAAALLSGCGKLGDLQRPGSAAKGAATTAGVNSTTPRRQDPSQPVTTVDPRNPSDISPIDPSRVSPVPGAPVSPNAPRPQGALPDPYNNR